MSRKLSPAELRGIVRDPEELRKGIAVWQQKGLHHLARWESRLLAEAPGAGAPYRVSVDLEKLERGRCSCMAARSRPFCKHSAALLVAWASAPEAFALATAPPPADEKKRASVKRGAVDAGTLLAAGCAQVRELVGELAATGIGSVGPDRAAAVRALAEPLRTQRLRRLSARTLELAALLEQGAAVDPVAWTDALADLLLAARRIERHVQGEVLEDRYLEELVGRSWTKKDRAPVAGLRLVELAWRSRVTADQFRIVESRFVELGSGESYTEKQILPMIVARQHEPKRSWAGSVLDVAAAGRYPGFSPFRLDLEAVEARPLGPAELEALRAVALPDLGAALGAFQERRKDLFAPDLLPVLVRAETLLAGRARPMLVDPAGAALFLPADALRPLADALREAKLRAVAGDLGLDGALPTLVPLALLVEGAAGLELRPIVAERRRAAPRRWVEVAREAGLSRAAVALGELREELGHAVCAGTHLFGPRVAEPLAQRLRDLGMARPAELLAGAGQKADPRERFDEIVKIHQVTGVALVRLAGAVPVDRDALEAVPTWPGVSVPRSTEQRTPEEIARGLADGRLDRFQAAVLADRHFSAAPPEHLADPALWGDAGAAPWVVRALAQRPDLALPVARRLLAEPGFGVATLSALRLLAALSPAELRGSWLARLLPKRPSPRRSWTQRLLGEPVPVHQPGREALAAARQEDRVAGARALAAVGDLGAIPLLRATLEADPGAKLREACLLALAELVDLEIADLVLAQLRRGDEVSAGVAVRAAGLLGDRRAGPVLWELYAEGRFPQLVPDAIAALGAQAEGWAVLDAHPELLKRKSLAPLLLGMEPERARERLLARLPDAAAASAWGERLLQLAPDGLRPELVARILALRPDLGSSRLPADVALWRRCRRA